MRRPRLGDRGSLTPFIIGVFIIGLLVVGTVTDIAVLQLDRQALQAQADSAALAAAQGADLDSIYARDVTTYVPIDSALAKQRAQTILAGHPARLTNFRLEAVATDGRTVYVQLSARVSPPFLRLLHAQVRIDARARATSIVQ
jgi:Flp pilus assembly protein TadG